MRVHTLIVVVLLGAVLAGVWLATGRDETPPDARPPVAPATPGADNAPGTVIDPPTTTSPPASKPPRPSAPTPDEAAAPSPAAPVAAASRWCIVVGRVVDGAGRPVAHARVELVDEHDGPADADPDDLVTGRNLGTTGGRFEVRVRGPTVFVRATAARVGSATWRRYRVEGDRHVLPDLVLEPGLTVDCIARFPDGTPVPHLRIRAQRVDDGDDTGLRAGLETAAAATTDAQGRVRFAGLAAGDYDVTHASAPNTATRVRAGGPPGFLTVATPMIAIQAIDERGQTIREGSFTVQSWAPPAADRVAAQHAAGGVRPDAPAPALQYCWISGFGWANALVEADRFILVRYAPEGFEPQTRAVRFPPGRWHATVRFKRQPLARGARLTIDLRIRGGEPAGSFIVTMTPLAPNAALRPIQRRIDDPADASFPAVPAGRYRIEIEPDRANLWWPQIGGANRTRCFHPLEREITLAPGARTLRVASTVCAAIVIDSPWFAPKHAVRFELSCGVERRVTTLDPDLVDALVRSPPETWFFVEPGRWTVRATTAGEPAVVTTVDAAANRVHRVDF